METEKEQLDETKPYRKRIRITQYHGDCDESSSRLHNVHALIEPAVTITSLIDEPHSHNTPLEDGGALLLGPRGADNSQNPSTVQGVLGSNESNGVVNRSMPLLFPPPEGPNQHQVGNQSFPSNARYILNSNHDMWDRGRPYYALDSLDTTDSSDDDTEYGVVMSSPKIGEGSLAPTLNQTRNAITYAYK